MTAGDEATLPPDIKHRVLLSALNDWRIYCQSNPRAELFEDEQVLMAACYANTPAYNRVLMKQPYAKIDNVLIRSKEFFGSKGLGHCVVVPDEIIPEGYTPMPGYKEAEKAIPIAARVQPEKFAKGAAEVEVVPITTDRQISDYVELCSIAFHATVEDLARLYSVALFTDTPQRAFVAYIDSVAVGSVGICPDNDTAYLFDVSTRPSHQRMGIGRQLIGVAMGAAKNAGCTFLGGHAVPKAEGWYNWMGFETVETCSVYETTAAAEHKER